MEISNNLLLACEIDHNRYAFLYKAVVMVTRIVKITPVSTGSAHNVLGVINVHGEIIPVINVRKLMGLENRVQSLDEKLIILHSQKRKIAIVVDSIVGMIEPLEHDIVSLNDIVPDQELFEGVLKQAGAMTFIINPESLLSTHDEHEIKSILKLANPTSKELGCL